jgi:hypothetical protein
VTMPARKPPIGGELLAIVKGAKPRSLEERGRALFVEDIIDIFPGKSRWWVNHSFLPEQKQKAGRDNFWWEVDVLAAIDRGELT